VSQPTEPTQPQPSEPRRPESATHAETQQAGPVRQLRVRRSPKYAAFIVTGAVLGLFVAVVAGGTGAVDPQTSRLKLIGYLGMALVLLGGLIGAGIAVALERFSQRSRIDVRGR
jgi:predicted lipid-binding transport protein (Tim44 family)